MRVISSWIWVEYCLVIRPCRGFKREMDRFCLKGFSDKGCVVIILLFSVRVHLAELRIGLLSELSWPPRLLAMFTYR